MISQGYSSATTSGLRGWVPTLPYTLLRHWLIT